MLRPSSPISSLPRSLRRRKRSRNRPRQAQRPPRRKSRRRSKRSIFLRAPPPSSVSRSCLDGRTARAPLPAAVDRRGNRRLLYRPRRQWAGARINGGKHPLTLRQPLPAYADGLMGPIRRIINLVGAVALTGGGIFAFFYLFLYAAHVPVFMLVGPITIVCVGLQGVWGGLHQRSPATEN